MKLRGICMSKQNYKYIWGTPETVEFKVSEE